MAKTPPHYIDYGGMTVYPQPILAPGMLLYGFPMEGRTSSLAELCDRTLNAALPVDEPRFVPLTSLVLLSVAHLPQLTCMNPPYAGQLWLQEREVAFWMLVGNHRDPPMWFNPYIFVDHPWAMSAGREIFGYPKEFAWVGMVDNPQLAKRLTLDTVGVEEFGSPIPTAQEAKRRRLLELDHIDGEFKEIGHSLLALLDALGQLVAGVGGIRLPSLKDVWDLLKEIKENRVPVVFLKQFRAISDGSRADFRRVLFATAQARGIHGLGLLGLYRLNINQLASHPIVEDLGLAAMPGPLTVPGFWMKFDFVLGAGGPIGSETPA